MTELELSLEQEESEIELELENWKGYSAYELAVKNGFRGSEAEWIASLNGLDGGVSTVNGIGHDNKGNVTLTGSNIKVSPNDARTIPDVVRTVDALDGAIKMSNDAIDIGGKYLDNARFR